jgi:putative oxidoreductase
MPGRPTTEFSSRRRRFVVGGSTIEGDFVMSLEANASAWAPRMLSVLRIMTGLLFLQHGTAKLLGFPVTDFRPEISSLPGIAGIFELVGGVLIVLGLFTRPVAFILAGMMAVAYFVAHWPTTAGPAPFFPIQNGGELAIMYCFVFLYLMCAGPGPWSVDAKRG